MLLPVGGHANADRLELAAIGTVHSVAHRLLRRYAIELGLSPRLEVFEHGAERALSGLLAAMPSERWEPLSDLAERLGAPDLAAEIVQLLAAKRGNRIGNDAFRAHLAASSVRVCELLAPDGPANDGSPIERLRELAKAALVQIEALTNDVTNDTTSAKRTLHGIVSSKRGHWSSYLDAINVKAGKRSGADGHLNSLRSHAGEVRRNASLHADIADFARLLADATLSLEAEYDKYKSERGLLDFTDLETLLLELLGNERLAKRLSKDFDLVLVDEFQDTNPLQLAIFQRLRSIAPRSRWVGDARQAIYGFRDTDPRLVSEVWNRVPKEHRSTLPNNHRSQKGLVELVGALFSDQFDEDPRQVPVRPAELRGVERWLLDSKNAQNDALSLSCGIAQLHAEGVRFGEIAVLERSNAQLEALAAALDEFRIPYLLESPGLFSTREGGLLLAGLRLAADRSDSLAAATALHLAEDPRLATPTWLSDRLRAVSETPVDPETGERLYRMPWEGHELFRPLEAIDFRVLAPSLVVQQVIEAFGLPERVHAWGESARRCVNLDSAIRHAREYEESALEAGRSATLSGLILHFEALASEGGDVRFATPGHDAVTLLTYHSAKGLEWPVVVLSGLNSERDPDMWRAVVRSPAVDEDPLASRELRRWIWPFGLTDGWFPKLRKGSGLEVDALASPEGQDQAQRETEESLRLLYVGCTRAKRKLAFAHRRGSCRWLDLLPQADELMDPELDPGEHSIDGIETTLVIRGLSPEAAERHRFASSDRQAWFVASPVPDARTPVPRFHSPSSATTCLESEDLVGLALSGAPFFPAKADEATYARIGNAVHSYMAALPSLRTVGEERRLEIAEGCLAAFEVSGSIPASVVVAAGGRFIDWIDAEFPGATMHPEMPVSGRRSEGGQWVGSIDLLIESPSGEVIVVDHKSAPIRRDACPGKAVEYLGQMHAYRDILCDAGQTVSRMFVHFPLAGVVVRVQAST